MTRQRDRLQVGVSGTGSRCGRRADETRSGEKISVEGKRHRVRLLGRPRTRSECSEALSTCYQRVTPRKRGCQPRQKQSTSHTWTGPAPVSRRAPQPPVRGWPPFQMRQLRSWASQDPRVGRQTRAGCLPGHRMWETASREASVARSESTTNTRQCPHKNGGRYTTFLPSATKAAEGRRAAQRHSTAILRMHL